MRWILAIFLFTRGWLLAIETDFDIAVVGTSPASMLEAIYHISDNKKVLILEADDRCGGAWKSIDICGIRHADLGCHFIGSDNRLREFFENYFGCAFICLDHPYQPMDGSHARCGNGFYFSKGCYELVARLEEAIASHQNALLLNKKLQSIFIDAEQSYIELNLDDVRYTTAKLILTPASHFRVDNPAFYNAENPPKHTYNHLYMLIEDPAPSRFTYLNGICGGMSRAMNLTPFLQMPGSNLQMIAVQTHSPGDPGEAGRFLDAFKSRGFLDKDARLIATDTYAYHQTMMNVTNVQRLGGGMIEVLDSSSFAGMIRYVDKWKSTMVPLAK